MRDLTTLIIEAQEARSRMQEARKRIKAEVRRKYEAQITRETAEATQDAEIDFARVLARVNASGVSQALLRREVLRTNVWSIWTYWRDLAGMEPDRVTASNAKQIRERSEALAKSHFRWSDDYGTLTAIKSVKGEELEIPVEYDMGTNQLVGEYYWPDAVSESAERAAWEIDGLPAWKRQLHAEIEAQIEAGNVPAPNEGE